jgi:hypothetical protein
MLNLLIRMASRTRQTLHPLCWLPALLQPVEISLQTQAEIKKLVQSRIVLLTFWVSYFAIIGELNCNIPARAVFRALRVQNYTPNFAI